MMTFICIVVAFWILKNTRVGLYPSRRGIITMEGMRAKARTMVVRAMSELGPGASDMEIERRARELMNGG